ncbi:MAG: hypothetical protein BMS9Abin05_1869 [Rhodothermia bacterium]|nr:MAG: hypothetical protein BMS9Abin05_1869 [Rhodothermia bacterium]
MSSRTSTGYRLVRRFVRLLVRLFFREIVYEGLERIPQDAGGLIVAWHPNGLVDPALILSNFPGKIIFGARHGLFNWPILGWLIKCIGTIPIYRTQDLKVMSRAEALKANQESLNKLADELASGSFSALFPEGISHDEPHLTEIKTGAARLYYRARAKTAPDAPSPVIIPVGLHYDRKAIFRSRVLVAFHEPIHLPQHLDVKPSEEEPANIRRARYRELTELIEHTLVEVVRATEDWNLHQLMHRARKLMRAERSYRAGAWPDAPSITEWDLGFARVWYGYRARLKTHPDEILALTKDLADYDKTIRAVGLEDFELTGPTKLSSPTWFGLLTLQFATVYLFLPPVILFGAVINVIPYVLLKGLDRFYTQEYKDAATVKMLGGTVLFPLTWGIAAFLAARGSQKLHLMFPTIPDVPVLVAIITIIFAIISGFLALRYNELSQETYRAIRVQITKRKKKEAIEQLAAERARLFERVSLLEVGLDLPGQVAPDGRIVSRETVSPKPD